MITATLIILPPHPEGQAYPSPREIQLQGVPHEGNKIQEGYDLYRIVQVNHVLPDGGITVYVERE